MENEILIKKLIRVCNQVAEDVENDAKVFDGQPFTGKTMAEYMGYHGAAISALANVLKELLENPFVAKLFNQINDK